MATDGHPEIQHFSTKKTKMDIIMFYTFISIIFDPLNPMKPSVLPRKFSLTSYGHPKGQYLAKMIVFGYLLFRQLFGLLKW